MPIETDRTAVILNLDLRLTAVFCFLVGAISLPHDLFERFFAQARHFLRILQDLRSPSKVALITLCGFDVPIDFVRMFDTPAACMTARTAPPGDDPGAFDGRL